MSDDTKSRPHTSPKLRTSDLKPQTCEVGYKRPPVGTRFQPGQSGNPRGRPRASMKSKPVPKRQLSEIVREESKRPVSLQQGGQIITLPSDQAVMRSLTGRAIQGNPSALRSFLLLQKELNAPDELAWRERLAILVAYKNGWREINADFKRRRLSPPLPDPRPERIEIDEDNRAAYLLEVPDVTSEGCTPAEPYRRRLGAEDYDWLRRNIPDTKQLSDRSPQTLLSPQEIRKLPYHIRMDLWKGLKGLTDLHEGNFIYVVPPRTMYNKDFITPCGRPMPLSGRKGYPVEPDDAEILLSQGWTLLEQGE